MDRKCYVYRHIRLDKNEPFYIGIGTRNEKSCTHKSTYCRAFNFNERGVFWDRVAINGVLVEIMIDDLSVSEVKEKEKELIKLYGKKNNGGLLVNLSDGGDGNHGVKFSDEAKKKMSDNWKRRLAIAPHPMKGRKMSEQQKLCMSNYAKKRVGILHGSSKKLIDISTNEMFHGISSAAKSIGVSYTYLRSMVYGKCNNITNIREIKNGKVVPPKVRKSKWRKVIDTKTGEVFKSAFEVAKKLNVKPITFRAWLYGQNKNPTSYQWL